MRTTKTGIAQSDPNTHTQHAHTQHAKDHETKPPKQACVLGFDAIHVSEGEISVFFPNLEPRIWKCRKMNANTLVFVQFGFVHLNG